MCIVVNSVLSEAAQAQQAAEATLHGITKATLKDQDLIDRWNQLEQTLKVLLGEIETRWEKNKTVITITIPAGQPDNTALEHIQSELQNQVVMSCNAAKQLEINKAQEVHNQQVTQIKLDHLLKHPPSFELNTDSDTLKAAIEGVLDAYTVVSLEHCFTSQDQLILADVCKALYAQKKGDAYFTSKLKPGAVRQQEIPEFLNQHIGILSKLGTILATQSNPGQELQNASQILKNAAGHILPGYQSKPEPGELSSNITLYKARNGELALKFASEAQRDDFYNTHFKTLVADYPECFVGGPQFEGGNNPNKETPVLYPDNPTCIYFPSYEAANGELAVNCVDPDLKSALKNLFTEGEKASPNNDRVVNDYDGSALYFNQNLFTESSYLTVDPEKKTPPAAGELSKLVQTIKANYNRTYHMLPPKHRAGFGTGEGAGAGAGGPSHK